MRLRIYVLYMVYSYLWYAGYSSISMHTHSTGSHKGRGSHVRNIWAYSQQQCQQSWLSKQRLRPTRTRTQTKPQPHPHRHTHTCSEEINDCDLLHLIAHKPGPSTCSNNFWLSHLSKFARMCERNRERRMNICGLQCRQSIYGRLSLTKRNVRFIKTNFNGQRHGQQTNTWLPKSRDSRCHTLHFIFDFWPTRELQINLKVST